MKIKWSAWLKSLFPGRGVKRTVYESSEVNQADHFLHRLDIFMMDKKPFLQGRYTLRQLSDDLNIPAYQLSAIINMRKGMNFSDYLNNLRIRHCEQIIQTVGGRKINIRQLSINCGFQSRNTFTLAFKKFTGMTPSEYVRKHW